MLKKNDIKLIRSLRLKKYRQKYNKFIVEGEKNGIEALKNNISDINEVYCINDFYKENQVLLNSSEVNVTIISNKELKQISNLKTPNSVLLVLDTRSTIAISKLKDSKFIVFLSDIMDPGNMGTIIRSCDWFDVDVLVVSPNSVDIYNPKVIQSSMGSLLRLPIIVSDFNTLQESIKDNNFTFYGTELEGDILKDIKYAPNIVVVIGNESKGISKEIDSKLDKRITIPRFNENTESLNAAVATGIVLYDIKNKILNNN